MAVVLGAIPTWLAAGLWGWLAGSALLLGAAVAYFTSVSERAVAAMMAFGSGVLIATLSLELMEEAYQRGGFEATAIGFLGGGGIYALANYLLARHGAQHRKRSQGQQASEQEQSGSGAAIAIGSLLDGVPESIVIGLSLLHGDGVSVITVIAIFLSNVPEGLSSAAGMKQAGRSVRYIFGVWGGITLLLGGAAIVGYVAYANLPPEAVSVTNAVAAGAILVMLVDTMIPEAFQHTRNFAGLVTLLGFLIAFVLTHLGG